MGKNYTVRTFTANSTWTAPAGVTQVVARTKIGPKNKLATPQNQGYFIEPTGQLFSFGNNTFGQLGTGNVTFQSSPVLVLNQQNFKAIVVNQLTASAFAFAQNGTLWSWGKNASGELGLGDVLPRSSPVLVTGSLCFQAVVNGTSSETYALTTAGTAYAWGNNSNGELGVGDVLSKSVPTIVSGGLTLQSIMPGGNGSACYFLTTSNALYACGSNTNGELGTGNVTSVSVPTLVLGSLSFTNVFCSGFSRNVYGIATNGNAYAWGNNPNGELGVGDVAPRSSPVLVLGGISFVSITPGETGQTYGLTADGTAYAWGSNTFGELGVGDVTPRSSPVLVLGGLKFQTLVVGNNKSVYGLTTSGVAYAWGKNANGELGVGDVTPRSSPVAVLGGLTFSRLQTGNNSETYGVALNGSLWAWGSNQYGELGIGNITSQSSPILVLGSLLVNEADVLANKSISVVPGTTYTVTLKQFFATVGPYVVSGGPVDSLTLEYFS